MRYITLNVSDNARIDIENTLIGTEIVKYNGDIVSSHWSMFGSVHRFEAVEQGQKIKYQINVGLKLPLRIGFDIFRNDKILLLM
jgi:hypothetical protein